MVKYNLEKKNTHKLAMGR